MKKIILSVISVFAISLLSFTAAGAGQRVQNFEGGVFAGFSLPVGGYHGGTSRLGMTLGLEGRYNFKGTPWDCGLLLELTSAERGYSHLYDDNYDRWQNNRTLIFGAVSHYNFRQGKKVNPFAGLALGIGRHDVVGDKYFPTNGTTMIFAPRIGVEFFHHIRLTAQMNLSRAGYNNASISLGIVLGGRPKKNRQ